MRPILIGDIERAAAALADRPFADAVEATREALFHAEAADAYRRRFGIAHPEWGAGTLSDCLATAPVAPAYAFWDEPARLRRIIAVLTAICIWREEKAGLNRARS